MSACTSISMAANTCEAGRQSESGAIAARRYDTQRDINLMEQGESFPLILRLEFDVDLHYTADVSVRWEHV